ncbi:MAG: hypothetical protein Tsb0033_13760 [Winogradskyella sp.]
MFGDNIESKLIPDFEFFKEEEKTPTKHTSFLLGAGFSVNQGYPTANVLNSQIQNINPDNYSINSEGNLFNLPATVDDPNWFYADAKNKFFIKELIALFLKENKVFDYEEFYDFLVNPKLAKREDFKKIANEFRGKFNINQDENSLEYNDRRLIDTTIKLINQLIQVLLVDKHGQNFYKPIHQMKPLPTEYTGFLQFLEQTGKTSIVHIHTLNHDILFETFNHTDWINGELSTGFEELGSKFYARMQDNIMIRLSCFTNRYDTRYRLYKLHGSIDQFPFRHQDGSPKEYIKIKKGVNISNLYKEVQKGDGEFNYENDFTNYYADFLSGTSSKILRYNDEGYYKEVFNHFKSNLTKSDRLIIVGYGCRDSKINEFILNNFDFRNKETVIIDPYPSDEVVAFANKLGAKLIKQTPDKSLIDKI